MGEQETEAKQGKVEEIPDKWETVIPCKTGILRTQQKVLMTR